MKKNRRTLEEISESVEKRRKSRLTDDKLAELFVVLEKEGLTEKTKENKDG